MLKSAHQKIDSSVALKMPAIFVATVYQNIY